MRPFHNEAQVPLKDETVLRLVLNFKAIDAIEGVVGKPMPDILPGIIAGTAGYAEVGKFVWGLLMQNHPEITMDEVAGLMFGEDGDAVGVVIGDLVRRSFNLGEPQEAKAGNPRKRRGASKAF